MTIQYDICKARKKFDLAVKNLLMSPYMFGVGKYEGLYQGNIRSWQFSKYLKLCKYRLKRAKKKLERLEHKFYRKKKYKS